MGLKTKMQKKKKDSKDDELKNDSKTTTPSDVTATEKLNQNHETKPSAQSEVTVTEKLNQNHQTKPSAQSEVATTEKLSQDHETRPSAQSEVTATEKLSQDHETKPSAQSEVTVTEKLNQNHETKPSAQTEVTATEKLNQDRETKTNAQSEVTPEENFNQNYETKPSAQSEVTAIEKLNQYHEPKPSAQSEVSDTDSQIDEKIKSITKYLCELQARKVQLQQANNDMCIHSSDFLLFHIMLSQEKEKEIKRLYDAEAQLQKANSHIKVTATEKLSQDHETKPSAQSEVTVTEKLNQNHETKPSAQTEVTATEKLNQDRETKTNAQSEVTPEENFNQNYETKPSAQSEVTAIEKLNQDHEPKPSAQSEVSDTDSQIDEKIKSITKYLCELQARKAQLQQANNDMCIHSSDFLLFHIMLSQEKEKEIKRLYDAEAQLQKANSHIKDKEEEINKLIKQKEEEINNLTAKLHDVEAQLQQAKTDIIDKEEEKNKFVKEIEEEIFIFTTKLHEVKAQLQQANTDIKDKEEEKNKLIKMKEEEINGLTTKLRDAEAQLQKANSDIKEKVAENIKLIKENEEEINHLTTRLHDVETQLQKANFDIKVNLEKEIIDLTVQNKSLRKKVDNENELLSRILEYVAEYTNESLLSPGNIIFEEKTHPLSCPSSQTITKIATILFVLRNKIECLEDEKKDLKEKLRNLEENDPFSQIDNSVMNINTTIQNQESINEMFTANDESFNNAVEEVRQELENKSEENDLLIKEMLSSKLQNEHNKTVVDSLKVNINDLNNEKQHLETKITSILDKNTTVNAEDIDELTEKCNGLTLNINESIEQLRGDVPSTSTEPKIKKKSIREEPTGNGSVKRRIKEVSADSAPTGHSRHKGADSKPILGCDIEGRRMFYNAKMENDVLLASSTEEISKLNPITDTTVQNTCTFEKPTNTDKKFVQMQIVVTATCDRDLPVETPARVQRMEQELRDAKAREYKLREQLNEYKNTALVDKTTKIVRKKRQLQHDQSRPYQP